MQYIWVVNSPFRPRLSSTVVSPTNEDLLYEFYHLKNATVCQVLPKYCIFSLPANEVCEGYVFTSVCHSVHRD